ncbi:O-antigen ligase [Rhodoferax sp.]|uniref:O-antigen ligase family protein n=1 Tax=Rhodoferax sp. TaxID=50421 RepID=UPI00271AF7BE|nr:O-antigen ligase family protein [Rhodoferax sp.]MDO9197151.1 O-antigen ligase family protein [Rhodoferax sp.]
MIVVLFIYFYLFRREFLLNGILTRLWAVGYIPGWPNSAPIPLLFGLWISFRNKFCLLGKFLIYVAIFMTFARTGLVGAFMITALFLYTYIDKYIKNLKYTVISLIIFCFALVLIYFESELAAKFYYSDRADVFHFAVSYIQNRPFLGYGGNTLDQLNHISTGYTPLLPWSHAHNWILEMSLRYGVVGGGLFFLYIMSVFVKIRSVEKKIMFAILLFLALFQTFMQEFVYLFFLSYLANDRNNIFSKNSR